MRLNSAKKRKTYPEDLDAVGTSVVAPEESGEELLADGVGTVLPVGAPLLAGSWIWPSEIWRIGVAEEAALATEDTTWVVETAGPEETAEDAAGALAAEDATWVVDAVALSVLPVGAPLLAGS